MKANSMKKSLLFLCLVVGGPAVVWSVMQHTPTSGAAQATPVRASSPAANPIETLTTVPAATHPSASDAQMQRWSAYVRRSPQTASAWVNLGDSFMQKARETADVTFYGRAEGVYRRALDLEPKNESAMIGLAWVAGGRHEFEQSRDWANKALTVDPKNNEAYGLLGDAAAEMGDYKEAFEKVQKMLDLRPDISSYSRGAHLLYLSGNTRKASWLMLKAVQSGGPYAENTAWCRAQIALIYFSNGAYVPAEKMLREGLTACPNNYHLLATLGKVKAAEKDYTAAIEFYKKAVEVVPQVDSVVALGDLYALTGKKAEAEKQYAIVDAVWKLYKANGVRGDMLVAQFYADHDRNLPEALRLAEEEYKTRKNVYAADTLAWCYFKNGRVDDAKRTIAQALQQNTPEALFLFHKGLIYAKAGDAQTARLALYQALSTNPRFHPLYAVTAEQTVKSLGEGSGVTQREAGNQPGLRTARGD